MDVRKILIEKAEALPAGDHSTGMQSVCLHVDTACKHLQRGQREVDETAFTDAVYRCNQAFEGSIKEAYRVLAKKDPQKITVAAIEDYLSSSNTLRHRVLAQFTNYRQHWRNPSTHDHRMGFDEDEALLAIVSVAAFAIVLCDQISERVAFNLMQPDRIVASAALPDGVGLLEQVTAAVQTYALANNLNPDHSDGGQLRTMRPEELLARYEQIRNTMAAYKQIEGALAGFLTSAFAAKPEIEVRLHHMLTTVPKMEADIAISNSAETVIVEIKYGRDRSTAARAARYAERQALAFLELENIAGVVLVSLVKGEVDYEISSSQFGKGRLKLVGPVRNRNNE